MNPWHDVSIGDNAPEIFTSIIEIPRHSKGKYELDKDTGMLMLDRVLYSSMTYPANYGFIPQTYCEDKDPLDVLVISQINIAPMCLVKVRPVGVMHMVDGDEADDKIIAVPVDDMRVNHIEDIDDVAPHALREIKHFFEYYKQLEGKTVQVNSLQNKETALKVIKDSMAMYKEKFGN